MIYNKKIPKVSVMVVVYNSERFIEECLDSIIAQEYKNLEVIVCDDASTDKTPELLKKYLVNSKLKIYFNKENLGITGNCNKALSLCTGEYVCFFAGDDVMLPDKIQKQVELMEKYPDASICYHKVNIFKNNCKEEVIYITEKKRTIYSFFDILEKNGLPGPNSIMARKKMIPIEGFDQSLPYVSDWLMFLELSLRGRIIFVDEILSAYRKHSGGISKKVDSLIGETIYTLNFITSRFEQNSLIIKSCRKALNRFLLGSFARSLESSDRLKMLAIASIFFNEKSYLFATVIFMYANTIGYSKFVNRILLSFAIRLR
jgi:glycosyltransferase involved in cell wall biosynthesis